MKVRKYFVTCLVTIGSATAVSAQNQLANPGFEDPITFDGPPFVGSWEGFSGGAGSAAFNSGAQPRTGTLHLELLIANTNDTFAGAFQDVPNQVPGTEGTFSGFHMTPSNPLDLGVEIRIEWRNSVANTEVGRTPNLTVPPTGQYSPFSLAALVPAGADTARVVYAIQTFGTEPTNNGNVYVDDTSYVPEPSTILTIGLAGIALAARRRR